MSLLTGHRGAVGTCTDTQAPWSHCAPFTKHRVNGKTVRNLRMRAELYPRPCPPVRWGGGGFRSQPCRGMGQVCGSGGRSSQAAPLQGPVSLVSTWGVGQAARALRTDRPGMPPAQPKHQRRPALIPLIPSVHPSTRQPSRTAARAGLGWPSRCTRGLRILEQTWGPRAVTPGAPGKFPLGTQQCQVSSGLGGRPAQPNV